MTGASDLPLPSPAGPASPAGGDLRVPHGHYRAWGVLRSEWTKLRTVRSTPWTVLVIVVAVVGLGMLLSWANAARWAQSDLQDRLTFDPTSISLSGFSLAQLVVGVLGVLTVSAEYGTGTIRATLAAVPNRPVVLAAKAAVFGALAVVLGEVLAFAAFFAGQAVIAGTSSRLALAPGAGLPGLGLPGLPSKVLSPTAPHATLGQPDVLRAVVGAGLYFAVLGLLALAIGALVRHTAGGIAVFVGLVLVLPLFSLAVPARWRGDIFRFFPASIGSAMTSTVINGSGATSLHPFPVWVGFGILCGYTAAALVLGAILLVRRDA